MAVTKRRLQAGFLGRISYGRGLRLQEAARERLLRARSGDVDPVETLLLLEHPHVFTLGRNARAGDVTATAEWLASHGVEVHETDRGGQVTYHGPGQLVGYPIVDLHPDRRDLRRYVRDLQAVLVASLGDLGIEAFAGRDAAVIGVWVEGPRGAEKIASIGVHVKRWVTSHGFALNVATDLSMFAGIVACGLPEVTMTSIAARLGSAPPLGELAAVVAARFAEVFGRELEALALDAPDPPEATPGEEPEEPQ